jgi:multicomponent Na+:H+ antiporter subunit D
VGGPAGFAAAILYSVVNALNKILLFLTVEMRGAIVGAVFVLGALSVAGVPPAAGFVGKLELFRAAVDSPAVLALFLLGSALSFVYVFQIYQFDFWRGERRGALSGWPQQSLVALVGLAVLALGLWPEPLLALSHEAAEVLAGAAG